MRVCLLQYVLKNMSTIKTSQKSHQKSYLTKIFTSQSVRDRINTFRNLSFLTQQNQQDLIIQKANSESKTLQNQNNEHQVPSIKSPDFLRFDTAKNLSFFIKKNKIAPNIRILHALAHIEYNAFMSYTDTYFTLASQIKNFQRRQQFKSEIKRIALDQGDHFCLLNDRLEALGWKYGSVPVIDQLCLAIQQTKTSLIERIARISLLHQGRGLKAIGKLISQLSKQKDDKSIEILRIIEKEEVFHFDNGVKWFKYICHQQNLNFQDTLQQLLKRKQFRYLDAQQIKNAAQNYKF